MVTTRSIITEALNRSNLVSRRQTPPADMVETSFRLLRGIASQFSKDNLLQFLVAECNHDLDKNEFVMNPEYLICVSHNTHQAIHYGDESLLLTIPKERSRNDTCPWKQ